MEITPGETYELGACPCCGQPSRLLVGRVLREGARFADYEVHTTRGARHEPHVGFFVVFEGSPRRAVALEIVAVAGEPLAIRPLDAAKTPIARDPEVGGTLTAEEAVGSPLGALAVDIAVAVYAADPRFVALVGETGSPVRATDLAALAGLERVDRLRLEQGPASERAACPCCGGVTERVAGRLVDDAGTHAEYIFMWTRGGLEIHGAEVCVVLGSWSASSSNDDRFAVALHLTYGADAISVGVVDATGTVVTAEPHVGRALDHVAVVGTPVSDAAGAVASFALARDPRLAELGA